MVPGEHMGLRFSTRFHGALIRVEVNRPVSTELKLFVDERLIAEASRPASTDMYCAMQTWIGRKPKWIVSAETVIDGIDCEVIAIHVTTFTSQYIEIERESAPQLAICVKPASPFSPICCRKDARKPSKWGSQPDSDMQFCK